MRYFLFILLLLTSCKKHDKVDDLLYPMPNGLFICNEGNFMYGNATLSIYDPTTKAVQNQVYARRNNGVTIGDVFQSMKIIDGKGFMVVNNSQKIIVIDPETYEHVGKITDLTSPRYIEVVSDNKIYVSDLYGNVIHIVDPKILKVTGTINIGKGTEQMVKFGSHVFACSWASGNKIYRIDTRTDALVDEITVTKQPNSMVLDKNGKIWVLSDGGYYLQPSGQVIAKLTRIDAETFTIEQEYEFSDIKYSPSRLSINGSGDTIYFINGGYKSNISKAEPNLNGVYKMSIESDVLPSEPFIAEVNRLFYALGIDPKTDEIYIGDAIDYQQKGLILRYSPSGVLVDMFKTDIIPGSFCFK